MLNRAHDRLPARMYMHMLNGHFLLRSIAPVAVEGIYLQRKYPHELGRLFDLLIGNI